MQKHVKNTSMQTDLNVCTGYAKICIEYAKNMQKICK